MRKTLVFCLCLSFGWQCNAHKTDPLSKSLLIPYLKGDLYGFSDQEGNVVIQPKYESVKFFNNYNLALVRKDSLCGYINPRGEFVIPCISEKPAGLNKI